MTSTVSQPQNSPDALLENMTWTKRIRKEKYLRHLAGNRQILNAGLKPRLRGCQDDIVWAFTNRKGSAPTSRAELSTWFPVIPPAALALLVLDHQRDRYKTREGELLDPSVLGLQR